MPLFFISGTDIVVDYLTLTQQGNLYLHINNVNIITSIVELFFWWLALIFPNFVG